MIHIAFINSIVSFTVSIIVLFAIVAYASSEDPRIRLNVPSTTKRPNSTTTTIRSTLTTSVPTNPPPLPVKCPKPPYPWHEKAHLLPNPNDCGSYYACDPLGRPILMKCPDGLHFNPKLKVCDWPWDSGCPALPSTSTEGPKTTTARTNGTRPTSSTTLPPQ